MKLLTGASGHAAAVAAVALATWARWLLDPVLGNHSFFVTYYVAILAVAWLASLWPSVVALLLGAWAADFLFVPPRYKLLSVPEGIENQLGLALYCMVGIASIAVCAAMRAAERHAELRGEALRVTLSSIGDAVITTDREGRVASLNPVAAALTGWSPDEAAGRPLHEVFRILDEETRRTVEDPVRRVLAEGNIVGLGNHTLLLAKDGTERPIDESGAPIRDADGKVLGVVLIFRDVRERRRSENQLRQTAADLSEANSRQNEFLALLSHELRNPLAPMRNALEILRQTGSEGNTGKLAMDMMQRQFRQVVRLVDDLLDVSRISRGSIPLRREALELTATVRHAVEAARPHCKSMQQELVVALPPEPLYLNADPARLAQIVDNLLNNACKFTGRGGRIRLAVEREGKQAIIRVQDTGIGIAADEIARIFEMFAQVDASIERTQGGLGIGLMLVKNLVEQHGGTVEARSDGLGKGAEFVVRLPVLDEPSQASRQAPPGIPPEPAVKRRILVADDNRDAAATLAMLLEHNGHEVHTAHDGVDAVAAAAKFQPDVVLLDIGMPKLNGYEAARRIRQTDPRVVLLAITGWGQDEDRQRSEEAGFDAHVTKPVEYTVLMKLLTEAGERSRGL